MSDANAVQQAIDADDFAAVERLVADGAKLTAGQANEWLFGASAINDGEQRLRQVAAALAAGADIEHEFEVRWGGDQAEYYRPLAIVAASGHLDVVRLLLDKGADVNGISYTIDDYWEEDSDDPDEDQPPKENVTTALGRAAEEGKREVYDFLFPLTSKKYQKVAEKLKTW